MLFTASSTDSKELLLILMLFSNFILFIERVADIKHLWLMVRFKIEIVPS